MSIAIGAASVTHRQPPPPRPDPATTAANMLDKIDTKNQGFIDKEELQVAAGKLQAGQSGASTADTSKADALFKKLDGNDDGKITKNELTDGLKKLSAEFDNQNSQVNAGRARLEGRGGPPPGAEGGAPGKAGAGDAGGANAANGASGSSATKSYDAADTNQDGTVSAAELLVYQISTAAKAATSSTSSSASSGNASSDKVNATAAGSPQAGDGASKLLAQLARAYAATDQLSPSTGSTVSVSA